MRKNLFIFILLILGLVSCNLDSKLLDNKGGSPDNFLKDVVNNVQDFVSNVQGDEPIKEDVVNKVYVEKVVIGDSVIKDEKGELISALINDINSVMGLLNQDKAEVEDANQYGMKDEVFKFVLNEVNGKTLDHDDNKKVRRLFYSSVLYNKERIEDFAEILKKVESDNRNKGTWIQDIMNAVVVDLQFGFERVINKLEKNREQLDKLSLVDLREIKSKLEEIQLQKLNWRKAVDSLISSYKAKADGIDSDSKKLIEHIEKKYKDLIKVKISGMKAVSNRIIAILGTIK
ncbi:Antigen P35 (plasmid) [Borrelia crocidurae DOU]|uniref:Antigen P35 n=1 Tax=Borrelia crocidurae DOU TaxID=1293575 RepID=W5SJF0_9SPIR|nr:complement regulator-acquiring protein [Borrelia crocidurae]AHH07020.1 Antigen P35 [Borrelia crocidurae DOU]